LAIFVSPRSAGKKADGAATGGPANRKGSAVKCQFCSSPATVHLTDIVNNQKKELHLCQACAEAQHLVTKQQEINLPAILQALIGQHLGPQTDELARLTCPACGIKYMEFRAQGRLGCPHDYAVFRTGLGPLLERIHRSTRHLGKAPRRGAPPPARQAELVELRRRLQSAVDAEAYEEAARLRDLLRKKEATDESG
jgi:protein arginine kinase activator